MFDSLIDELSSWPTDRLLRERESLIVRQRELRTRELAVLRGLDDRGKVDCSIGSQGESARTVRDKAETARALDALPAIADVALEGSFSDEQLSSVVKLADGESDQEWARRGPATDPLELERLARRARKPSADESRARHAARELRMWRSGDASMPYLRGQLPDEMGDQFERTITQLTEQMKVKGEPWAPLEQRAADALLALCAPQPADDEHAPTLGPLAGVQVAVPVEGPAEIAGVPIADTLLEQLRANASITPMLVDDHGVVLATGRATPALSPKIRRAVLLRDTRCRMPGCGRQRGLEVHHLMPRSRGGADDVANLAAVCPAHHRLLVPHGELALVGNPNAPDGSISSPRAARRRRSRCDAAWVTRLPTTR